MSEVEGEIGREYDDERRDKTREKVDRDGKDVVCKKSSR